MSERICPQCGKPVAEEFSFCPYCAAPLKEKKPDPPAPDRFSTQEILDGLSDLPADPEPVTPPPELPPEAKVDDWEMIDLRPRRPGRGPDVSGLYPGKEEPASQKDRPSWLLRILIFLVTLLLAAVCALGVLLVVNPFGWGPDTLEDLTGLLRPTASPAATLQPAQDPQAEATATPTPEPTPTPTPELPLSQEELQTIITEYYRSYLECINAQDMSYLVHSSAANKVRASTYALGEANMGTLYDTETFVVEPDWDSLNLYSDGTVIMLNLTFTFSGTPRQGGGTPTVTTNRVTYRVIQGSGEDGWVVDMTGFVGEEDYANHGYAFSPDAV